MVGRIVRALGLCAIVTFGFAAGGCLLMAAAATGAYVSSTADKDRKAFEANNVEREKAGLPPLTRDEWESGQRAAASTPGEAPATK